MTREVFELIHGMDTAAADIRIALFAAPLIAGIKPSNLLTVPQNQTQRVKDLLQGTKLSWYLLDLGECRTVFLLYRYELLAAYMQQPEVKRLLCQSGYRDLSIEGLFAEFWARYRRCIQEQGEFPHEMGLFLGYPPEDVRGFIENSGNHALYAGYWKVYRNKAEKCRLFALYDRAQEAFLKLVAKGFCVKDLLKYV